MRKCWMIWALVLLMAALAWLAYTPEESTAGGAAVTAADLGLLLVEEDGEVIVLGVSERSPAAMAGFEPGDRILSTDGMKLRSVEELEGLFPAAQRLPVLVLRDRREEVIVLPVK